MGNYNIRNSITEREPFVFREFLEDLLGPQSYGIIAGDNEESRLDYIQKFDSQLIARTISEEGCSFTDNIPCSIKGNFILFAEFKEFTGPAVIGVIWT